MKVQYTFKHIDHSDALQDYTSEALEAISKFLVKQGHATVCFSKHKNEFTVEASINTAVKYFRASATDINPYAAADMLCEKLERQFLKTVKQVKSHKKPELAKEVRHSVYRKAA